MMILVARGVTVFSFAWILAFWLLYGFSGVRPAFQQFAGTFFDDASDGIPLTFLAIPLLLAGTVCTWLSALDKRTSSPHGWTERLAAALQQQSHALPPRCRVILHMWQRCNFFRAGGGGDMNFDALSVCFILFPLAVYLLTAVGRNATTNSLGKIAIFAMNVLLVPVARHSAVLGVFGWNPASAVRLHIWTGRIVVVSALAHGFLYLYRWKFYDEERLLVMLIPPRKCWTMGDDSEDDSDYEPVCLHSETECSCYDHFRNLTGVLALSALVVLAITSLNSVRRRFYTIFYRCHVVAGPLVLIMVILHYRRSILYIAGGVLYYLASTFPVLVENTATARRDGGTRLVSVERIRGHSSLSVGKTSSARSCMSLTFQASHTAVVRYRAGQYVQLYAPSIGAISHPFTINTVPGKADQLRVIFRAVGPFTTKLAKAMSTLDQAPPVPLSLEGFHGSPYRTQQVLKHDAVVIVAGGIGITPYLSLLDNVHSILCRPSQTARTKKLVLHWMCRDACLVDYVRRNYLDALIEQAEDATGFQINIFIHRTFDHQANSPNSGPGKPSSSHGSVESINVEMDELHGDGIKPIVPIRSGVPFHPSKFAAISKSSYRSNVVNLLSFVSIGWGGLVLMRYCATNFDVSRVLPRIVGPFALVFLAAGIAIVANLVYQVFVGDRNACVVHDWTPVKSHEEWDEETGVVQGTCCRTDSERGPAVVNLEEKCGRPTIPSLVRGLDHAACPGLFVCGPKPLVVDLQDAVRQDCRWGPHRSMPTNGRQIALYEESFHL